MTVLPRLRSVCDHICDTRHIDRILSGGGFVEDDDLGIHGNDGGSATILRQVADRSYGFVSVLSDKLRHRQRVVDQRLNLLCRQTQDSCGPNATSVPTFFENSCSSGF